jgi:hypothetical protein
LDEYMERGFVLVNVDGRAADRKGWVI